MATNRPSTDITQQVRAFFIASGSTLTEWCRSNDIDPARAWRALQGKASGPKALELRARIQAAAGER